MKKLVLFFIVLFLSLNLNAQNLSVFVASSASKAMEEVKNEFLKSHPNDNIDLVFGASGKYYQLLKQGREFDLFFSADTKYAKAIYDNKNALIKPRVYVLGVLALYSLDENLLQGGVENLKEKAGKITHLSIANPKVAPYGIAAKEVLENLDLNELFKDKIVLGENISVPVLHVDSKNSDIAIVAYSLVSPINHPKGKTSIINPKYFSPLEQSYVITKYAKDKKLAFEFSEFIGSSKAKEIFKKYGFSTP
ncbi:molybdate ABC transporter substrate-binding protein [Campylobacter coli]|nr:molybdate ABC transporter substrate-binding protein [Campylobacter coli]EKS3205999.1 molybdate ABC transporter substrate-binding protein [Campylobacter coli]